MNSVKPFLHKGLIIFFLLSFSACVSTIDDAKSRDRDINFFSGAKFDIHTYPDPGKIAVTLNSRLIQPLPAGAVLQADLCLHDLNKPIVRKIISDISDEQVEIIFEAQNLPAGDYVMRVNATGPDDKLIREEASSSFFWKGQPEVFKNIKILNNFVWELLTVKEKTVLNTSSTFVFNNPYNRWVYINTKAEIAEGSEVWVSIDSNSRDSAVIVHSAKTKSSLESMRFLSAGSHTIFVGRKGNAVLKHLVIRSVPELQYAFYNLHPHIHPYGPYDWKFLLKDILPNVNVMISEGAEPPHLKEWKNDGKKWITIAYMPKLKRTGKDPVDEIYKYWSNYLGLQHPLMDGIIVDEFTGNSNLDYDLYRKAVERIYSDPLFKGKAFMPYYGGAFHGESRIKEFVKTSIEGGGYLCRERYFSEKPTPKEAMALIKRHLLNDVILWEDSIPGVIHHMVMVLGYMSQPPESLNTDPSVNFKTYMDMQFNFLATHPAFFGLGGIQEYHSSYADEETIRWAGRLFRHYCIEGNTDLLTKDPYKLTHIRNPDFSDGSNGWTVSPAEEGSMKILIFNGYSWLQGRYPRTNMGDTFLWTKRSAKKPNVFRQEIKDLTPGSLYSLKMITADYQDLINERTVKTEHSLTIQIDNADLLSGSKNGFQFIFPSNASLKLGKFNGEKPYWMNYHWRVFRASGTTAKLIVKDWKNAEVPGGPVGQELMFNFIEIQPYLEE